MQREHLNSLRLLFISICQIYLYRIIRDANDYSDVNDDTWFQYDSVLFGISKIIMMAGFLLSIYKQILTTGKYSKKKDEDERKLSHILEGGTTHDNSTKDTTHVSKGHSKFTVLDDSNKTKQINNRGQQNMEGDENNRTSFDLNDQQEFMETYQATLQDRRNHLLNESSDDERMTNTLLRGPNAGDRYFGGSNAQQQNMFGGGAQQ